MSAMNRSVASLPQRSPVVCSRCCASVRLWSSARRRDARVVAAQLGGIEELRRGALRAPVVAYEPVWAIGTGLTASPQEAQEVHTAIRAQLAAENAEVARGVRILTAVV